MFYKVFFYYILFFMAVAALQISGAEKKENNELDYQEPAIPSMVSSAKIRFIRAVLHSKRLSDFSDRKDLEDIYKIVAGKIILDPEKPLDRRTEADLEKEVTANVEKLNKTNQELFRKKVEKEADTRFTLFKKGEKITIHYRRGSRIYSATGVYYGRNGGIVQIGLKTYPFYDILEEFQVRLDPKLSEKKRKEFIAKKISKNLHEGRDSVEKSVQIMKDQIFRNNIVAGYIQFAGLWYTARGFTNMQIMAEKRKRAAQSGRFSLEIQKIREKIKKRKAAASKAKGADREPGIFSIAFWNFTRNEIKLAFLSGNKQLVTDGAIDRSVSDNPEIDSIQLGYDEKNRLNHIKIVYTTKTKENAAAIKEHLKKLIGPDDYSKTRKDKDPEPKPEDTLTWTGKTTQISLVQVWKDGKLVELYQEKKYIPPQPKTKKKTGKKPASSSKQGK